MWFTSVNAFGIQVNKKAICLASISASACGSVNCLKITRFKQFSEDPTKDTVLKYPSVSGLR